MPLAGIVADSPTFLRNQPTTTIPRLILSFLQLQTDKAQTLVVVVSNPHKKPNLFVENMQQIICYSGKNLLKTDEYDTFWGQYLEDEKYVGLRRRQKIFPDPIPEIVADLRNGHCTCPA